MLSVMKMNDKISIVIPTKNRPDDVVRCINSISNQTLEPYEIVIVDASDSNELKEIQSNFSKLNINYIHTEKPGLTIQRNIGIRECKGDIIVFSDDDMIWDINYLKEILYVFNQYEGYKIGGVTGNIIWISQKEKLSFSNIFLNKLIKNLKIFFLLPRSGNGFFQSSGHPTIITDEKEQIKRCEFLYGGTMTFRKDVIKKFMFDEHLTGYGLGEDDDIAYRVSRSHQNYFAPKALIVHNNISQSSRGNKENESKIKIENWHYLFKKNIPQDKIHKIAFYWSILGLIILEIINIFGNRNFSGMRGYIRGIRMIAHKKSDDKCRKNESG